MEYDERATDSRIKTGIQNILGGVVLASIPLLATAIIAGWVSISNTAIQQKHIIADAAELQRRIESMEVWRVQTNGNRFRWEDGLAHDKRLSVLERDTIAHDRRAEKYINIIERNTSIILDNQRKAHTHRNDTNH